MRVFVLDNYDSFTYNIVHQLGELGASVDIERADAVTVEHVVDGGYDAVVVSPGPGLPCDAGISVPLVRSCSQRRVPLLGVCLGHQAIAEAFGGRVVRASGIMHGKTSPIHHDGAGVLASLPDPFVAMRYHSMVVERDTLPGVLEVTAWTTPGEIMGIRHRREAIEGVQFHPESILTPEGNDIIRAFITTAAAAESSTARR